MSADIELSQTDEVQTMMDDAATQMVRDWLDDAIKGGDISRLEARRVNMMRRRGGMSEERWQEIIVRATDEYFGDVGMHRVAMQGALVSITAVALSMLNDSGFEPTHRISAGRLALKALEQQARLLGVEKAPPKAPEVAVTVTVEQVDPRVRLAQLLGEARGVIVDVESREMPQDEMGQGDE